MCYVVNANSSQSEYPFVSSLGAGASGGRGAGPCIYTYIHTYIYT